MRLLLSPMVDISWGTIPKVDRWLPHTDTQMNICSSSPLLWWFGPESWTWVQLTAGENMKHHHDGNTMLSRSWSTCLKSENKHWFKESQLIWLRRPRAPQQSSQMTPCWGHWSVYLLSKHFCISVLFGGLCFNVNSIIIRLYFFLTYVFLTSMITCLLVNGSADQNKCKMFVCFLLLGFKSTTKNVHMTIKTRVFYIVFHLSVVENSLFSFWKHPAVAHKGSRNIHRNYLFISKFC